MIQALHPAARRIGPAPDVVRRAHAEDPAWLTAKTAAPIVAMVPRATTMSAMPSGTAAQKATSWIRPRHRGEGVVSSEDTEGV